MVYANPKVADASSGVRGFWFNVFNFSWVGFRGIRVQRLGFRDPAPEEHALMMWKPRTL